MMIITIIRQSTKDLVRKRLLVEARIIRHQMPNLPYLFADSDATLTWDKCLRKGNTFSLTYDNFSLQKPGRAFYGKVRVSL